MVLSGSDLNFNTACCVAQLILVFCGCFEDSSWEWFLCSKKSIVKSIGIEYCNTFVKKVLVLLLPILFCPSICIAIGNILGKYC